MEQREQGYEMMFKDKNQQEITKGGDVIGY